MVEEYQAPCEFGQTFQPDSRGHLGLEQVTCNIDIPCLPSIITKAHILTGLEHSSLISTQIFCNAGCQVSFNMDECRVYYNSKLVLTGVQNPVTELWRLPTNPTAVHPT